MRYTLYSDNDAFLQAQFLDLPRRMYPPERQTQDEATELELLQGTHVLSVDFAVYPFLALDENDQPAARCLLTLYPGDENGYVGFFESEDSLEAAQLVLDAAAQKAKLFGRSRLVGPYHASFWLGYRFKTSNFFRAFTGEPNNRAFYPRLWKQCGFTVTDHYFSNQMRVPTDADRNPKAERRLRDFRNAGYDFRTITLRTFDSCLRDIYDLLTRLYSSFPGYQEITERQFFALFSPLRYVLDHEMVKLVYKDGALAAFVICVPNYGNLTAGSRTPRKLREILRIHAHPAEFSIPYMGVAPEHAGLGNALSELLKHDLQRKNCTSITALIHDGKVTGGFYRILKTGQTDYVLMAKELYQHEKTV